MDLPIIYGNYQYWQANELAKNGNLCERPDLKIAKSGHSYKSPFMAISRNYFGKSGNCHFWLVKVPLGQLPKLLQVVMANPEVASSGTFSNRANDQNWWNSFLYIGPISKNFQTKFHIGNMYSLA